MAMDKNDKNKLPRKSRLQALSEQIYSRMNPPKLRQRRVLRHEHDDAVKEDIDPEVIGLERQEEPEPSIDSAAPPLAQFYDDVLKDDKKQKFWTAPKIFLIFSVFFFVTSSFVAYYLLVSGFNEVSTKRIKMFIKGPNYVESGDLLQLQVFVENLNSSKLDSAKLVVDYPLGTKIPNNDYQIVTVGFDANRHKVARQRINLDSIDAGELKKGTVRARLFGQKDKIYPIRVSLEYRIKGSSAIFSVDREYKIKLASDALAVNVSGPKEAIFGQNPSLVITVKNNSLYPMSGVALEALMPLGVEIVKATPKPTKKDHWYFSTLNKNEEQKITLELKVDGQSGDQRVFKFLAGSVDPKSESLHPVISYNTAEHKITVARPFLATFISAGKENDAGYSVVSSGSKVESYVNWVNTLPKPIEDVVLVLSLDGYAIDKYGVSARDGFYKSIDNLIVWDKTTVGKTFEFVKPAANGKFKFNLAIKDAKSLAKITNPSIKLTVHASAKRQSESGVPDTLKAVVEKEVRVQTDLGFSARSLYTENPLKSAGPFPPRVDQPTTYGVEWTVVNSTNMTKDTTVTAFLPPNVSWGKISMPATENISYNPATGRITWRLGSVKPGTGYYLPARRVYFNVTVTPSVSQLNKEALLLQEQRISATDAFTDTAIKYKIKDLDTKVREADSGDFYYKVVK